MARPPLLCQGGESAPPKRSARLNACTSTRAEARVYFFVFSSSFRVFISVTGRNNGFSLIEVVIVTAIIALALTLAGPRIGAGIGRLELDRSAQSIRNFIKLGRVQAQRTDREHYVVIDRKRDVITLLDPEMRPLRQEELPSSVQIMLDSSLDLASIAIAPSGIVRGEPIRLRGRSGDLEITLQ